MTTNDCTCTHASDTTGFAAEHFEIAPDLSSRRSFLKGLMSAGAFTIVGSSVAGVTLGAKPMSAWGLPGAGNDPVIVNIFLRGGADALNVVVPYGDDDYYRIRGSISRKAGDYANLDGFFGLNNAFAGLLPLYESGQIAFIQAAGSNDPTRSHFVAQPIMDAGFGPGGWLQRALAAKNLNSAVSGVTIGARTTDALAGPFGGIALKTIDQYVSDAAALEAARPALEAMYGAAPQPLEQGAVLGAFASIDQVGQVVSAPDAVYPNVKKGVSVDLREAAALIKADIGVRCVGVNHGGWDQHSNEVTRMEKTGSQLTEALTAFWEDLGAHRDRVVVVVNTEFGRTAHQNGSGGTDHGHGGFMMVMGTSLADAGGGQVHLKDGRWPGLTDNDLYLERYQAITTDFRSVFAEVAGRHLGVQDMAVAFPDFEPSYLGLLPEPFMVGDVDGSGAVDDADVKAILDSNVGNEAPGYNSRAGDVNGDGRTDLLDALILARQNP